MMSKLIIASSAVAGVAAVSNGTTRNVGDSMYKFYDNFMSKANERTSERIEKTEKSVDDALDSQTCWSALGGCYNCCASDNMLEYAKSFGAHLLVGSSTDVVMNYRYFYCQETDAFRAWDNSRPGHFRRKWVDNITWWNNSEKKQCALWEKATLDEATAKKKHFDDVDDTSAMKICGLQWEQFNYMRKLDKEKVQFDQTEWDAISKRRFIPEVVDEEAFWVWAADNQRAVEKKFLWNVEH